VREKIDGGVILIYKSSATKHEGTKKRNIVTFIGPRLRKINSGSTVRKRYSRLKAAPTGQNSNSCTKVSLYN
jgi:hypothetical protein